MIRVSGDIETNVESDCSTWALRDVSTPGVRKKAYRGIECSLMIAQFELFSKHMFENLKGFFKRKRNCVTKNKVTFQLNWVHKRPTDDGSFEPSSLNRVGILSYA